MLARLRTSTPVRVVGMVGGLNITVMHRAVFGRDASVPMFAAPAHAKCTKPDRTGMQHQRHQSDRRQARAEFPDHSTPILPQSRRQGSRQQALQG